MNNNNFSPNAISHKELNILLSNAKKEVLLNEAFGINELNKDQEFNDLIKDWTNKSKEILLALNKQDQLPANYKNEKSLIAFGAMGAHINMALQALKATEFDR